MKSIKIEVKNNLATVIERPKRITAGTVGLPVEFTFDSHWDGLSKTAVFMAGSEQMAVEMETTAIVPWEILMKPGVQLSIGACGVNADGTVAIPTVWANVGVVHHGATIGLFPSTNSTATIWKKLQNAIGNLLSLKTNSKDSLVSAVNEVYDSVGSHKHDDRYYTEAQIDDKLSNLSAKVHDHDERYYTEEQIDEKLSGLSEKGHDHNELYYTQAQMSNQYYTKTQSDGRYYTQAQVDAMGAGLAVKGHEHDERYYTIDQVDSMLTGMPVEGHNHDDRYYTKTQSDGRYYTQAQVDAMLAGMPVEGHNHDDRYYTEEEINGLLERKAPTDHKHSASDINSGTLSSDRLPTVPVTKGGTGATNAATARTNLGITPANIGAVPTSRKINNKELNADIALSASDVGAAPASHTSDKNNPHGVTASQLGLTTETWTFTLEDGSTVTKAVYVG